MACSFEGVNKKLLNELKALVLLVLQVVKWYNRCTDREGLITPIESVHGIDNEVWDDIIDYHFENLSPKNNGSVLSFASGDSNQGAVRRYIEDIVCVF